MRNSFSRLSHRSCIIDRAQCVLAACARDVPCIGSKGVPVGKGIVGIPSSVFLRNCLDLGRIPQLGFQQRLLISLLLFLSLLLLFSLSPLLSSFSPLPLHPLSPLPLSPPSLLPLSSLLNCTICHVFTPVVSPACISDQIHTPLGLWCGGYIHEDLHSKIIGGHTV